MEHPRTTTARENDDSAIIDAAQASPSAVGHGGGIATDVGTRDDLAREVDDPESHERVTKGVEMANGQVRNGQRR
ncbi:hypothetical protein ACQKJZ_02945 [Sphingomonas sp. NPDC019816]|uniref:hypothetical protein n=1 Tax=Sphingomonas sp. NPDC019816 TaxID=3390679 RepID=UPI003CFE0ED0